MDSSFFVGYKKTCLAPDEVLVSILIPFTSEVLYCTCNVYKGIYCEEGIILCLRAHGLCNVMGHMPLCNSLRLKYTWHEDCMH